MFFNFEKIWGEPPCPFPCYEPISDCAILLADGRVVLGSQFLPLSKSVCADATRFS